MKAFTSEFAPLVKFLDTKPVGTTKLLLPKFMFMGCEDGLYQYKNEISRAYLVLTKDGLVVEAQPGCFKLLNRKVVI